jgi:hypothetical protein
MGGGAIINAHSPGLNQVDPLRGIWFRRLNQLPTGPVVSPRIMMSDSIAYKGTLPLVIATTALLIAYQSFSSDDPLFIEVISISLFGLVPGVEESYVDGGHFLARNLLTNSITITSPP